jgi:hypothetical protein
MKGCARDSEKALSPQAVIRPLFPSTYSQLLDQSFVVQASWWDNVLKYVVVLSESIFPPDFISLKNSFQC